MDIKNSANIDGFGILTIQCYPVHCQKSVVMWSMTLMHTLVYKFAWNVSLGHNKIKYPNTVFLNNMTSYGIIGPLLWAVFSSFNTSTLTSSPTQQHWYSLLFDKQSPLLLMVSTIKIVHGKTPGTYIFVHSPTISESITWTKSTKMFPWRTPTTIRDVTHEVLKIVCADSFH